MKLFNMSITTENSITKKLTQEIVDIIADDYHSALEKYRLTIPDNEKIIDVYVF